MRVLTRALPAADETIHRSASNGLRRSASAASFPAGTLTLTQPPETVYVRTGSSLAGGWGWVVGGDPFWTKFVVAGGPSTGLTPFLL